MSSHDTKSPTGGVSMGHVMEPLVLDNDFQLFKDLSVIIHCPTTVQLSL